MIGYSCFRQKFNFKLGTTLGITGLFWLVPHQHRNLEAIKGDQQEVLSRFNRLKSLSFSILYTDFEL